MSSIILSTSTWGAVVGLWSPFMRISFWRMSSYMSYGIHTVSVRIAFRYKFRRTQTTSLRFLPYSWWWWSWRVRI
jgi:hypothetical protein